MTDPVTYDDHKAFLARQINGAMAEYAGFSHARDFVAMMKIYSTDPRLQARYEQGFQDGKAMLLLEKEAV